MDKGGNITDKKFVGAESQNFPMDYHTWSFPIFIPEDPL